MSALFDQIQASLDRFSAAWKSNDGAILGSYFTDDGTLINPFGERADGRAAVSEMYSKYFGGMLAGSSSKFRLDKVRTVERDHALIDGEQTISGPDGGAILSVHVAALMRREGDSWRFADARPYTFATVPV